MPFMVIPATAERKPSAGFSQGFEFLVLEGAEQTARYWEAMLPAGRAVLAALDMVFSIGNTTIHMAGALGVRTWVALKAVPDWRWMLERADSLWYPTARLFRQTGVGDWRAPIGDAKRALEVLRGG